MATTLKRDPKKVISAAIRTLKEEAQMSPEQRRKATAALKRVGAKLKRA